MCHLSSEFCENLLSSFCVILLTNRETNRNTPMKTTPPWRWWLTESRVEGTVVVGRWGDAGAGTRRRQTEVRVVPHDVSPIVASAAPTRRPPDRRRRPSVAGRDQPSQPTVAVERVADQRQGPERQELGLAGGQGALSQCRQAIVVENDSLQSRAVTQSAVRQNTHVVIGQVQSSQLSQTSSHTNKQTNSTQAHGVLQWFTLAAPTT